VTPVDHESPEHRRLAAADAGAADWRLWGPYLAERAWGTVREDYSENGDAWRFFPHDHARSRAYRWGEDGLAAISDKEQFLCFSVALWNGNDPILKERLFGLSGPEGNHGEDVKEEYWYLDSTPTHSYMRMRYAYPQRAFPYDRLVAGGYEANVAEPEFELLDTDAFDDSRYFLVDVVYAKAAERDILIEIEVVNRGPDLADLTIVPTMWFRNTWSWGYPSGPKGDVLTKPAMWRGEGDTAIRATHPVLGEYSLAAEAPDEVLFTGNDTNTELLFGVPSPAHTKEAFHRYLVDGDDTAVNADGTGTKAATVHRREIAPGASATVRLRLQHGISEAPFADFATLQSDRQREADEFHATIQDPGLSETEAAVQRQAMAGLMWTKQLYYFDIAQWLLGDPQGWQAPPAGERARNRNWAHLNNFDVLSMPDVWEYPWYAAWDTAFHAIPLAMLDPAFAKEQLRLMTREWYMHPNGQLPAYEWHFGDVNPPVHAWAAWHVYQMDAERSGEPDTEFLEGIFHKLLLNFTWWVNRKDHDNNNVFQGGFLGLDNVSVFNRSEAIPTGGHLDQSDGTAWMAFYTLEMLKISLELAQTKPVYQDLSTKFLEHFMAIAAAMNGDLGGPGLWNEADGFFYDALHLPNDEKHQLQVRSMVGLVPLLAVEAIPTSQIEPLRDFTRRMWWFTSNRPHLAGAMARLDAPGSTQHLLFSLLSRERLERVLTRMLDEHEFLSPHGLRSLSKAHEREPYVFDHGGVQATIQYEAGESSTLLFGGNSNWRGPVWMPLNFLIIEALREYHRYYGDSFTIEYPTGSGDEWTLDEIADALADRLVSLFLPGPSGIPPSEVGRAGKVPDPAWHRHPLFYEYFHGDTGQGLGASHQTGWTALVAVLLQRRAHRRG
jgi:hypothetical protein